MSNIELKLHKIDNPSETLSVYFRLLDNPVAKKYFTMLTKVFEQNDTVKNPDRTYNFPGDPRNKAWLANRMNECIDTVNAYSNVIKLRAHEEMDQEHLNNLHKYFEIYQGNLDTPSPFSAGAPESVKQALKEYNILIHRYEDFKLNEFHMAQGSAPLARIVVNYYAERLPLADEDYSYFALGTTFGGCYLDYYEVGKPLLDLFHDGDAVVGHESVLPLKYYSAETFIAFAPTATPEMVQRQWNEFHDWWDKNKALMDELGFTKYDPKNALGHLPVGQLDRERGLIAGMTDNQILELIGQYPIILGLIPLVDQD